MHLEPYDQTDIVKKADGLFDARAAAAVRADIAYINLNGYPISDILEKKTYEHAPDVIIPTAAALSAMAYPDYFPGPDSLPYRLIVSGAILAANAGWCGTYGPGIHGTFDLLFKDPLPEGNYDMSQMHLLQIAYGYFNELDPHAREHLIQVLLAAGTVNRINENDINTSGGAPVDWSRSGYIAPSGFTHIRIGETENHILMIHTCRYLTNQLLYQRDYHSDHDNRRNGSDDRPSCTDLMLYLLRNILLDDFSEYNAKNYQTETRYALLNLYNYAYDHEVRLAARMVLDYISAHIAVSSSDLRRMVPFRRRNEGKNVSRDDMGYMEVGLVETTTGADPMTQHFAMLSGHTRVYGVDSLYHPPWMVFSGGSDGNNAVMNALSQYRLPPIIHDLFLNDGNRRFFQRLHRVNLGDGEVTGRNTDNYEIYAGSPSYLLTAGGEYATWAIDPGPVSLSAKLRAKADQQLGVAVPSSFIPTVRIRPEIIPLLNCGNPSDAGDIIQFGSFSDVEWVYNYGIAPDFVCGHQVHLPLWCQVAIAQNKDENPNENFGGLEYVDRGSAGKGPGFFLAFFRYGWLTVMEAFDTWLHPNTTFLQFKTEVFRKNAGLIQRGLFDGKVEEYRTMDGTLIKFVIWDGSNSDFNNVGAKAVISGESEDYTDQFLNGTIMNSGPEKGVIKITNAGKEMTLDMRDQWHPMRISESGEVEIAGFNSEIWVDFDWQGPQEGDFFRPFNSLRAAVATIDEGGIIKIMPGRTRERFVVPQNKRFKIVAPVGGVYWG